MMRSVLKENERLKAQIEALRPCTPRTPRNARGTSSRTSTPASHTSSRTGLPPGQPTPPASVASSPAMTPRPTRSPNAVVKAENTKAEHGDAIADHLRNQDHTKLHEQFDLSSPDCYSDSNHSLCYLSKQSLYQELSARAVDARLRRFCEKKVKSGKVGVPDWVHQEWLDLDKREILRLSLVEALKTCGTNTDAATRKLVKAPRLNPCMPHDLFYHPETHVKAHLRRSLSSVLQSACARRKRLSRECGARRRG